MTSIKQPGTSRSTQTTYPHGVPNYTVEVWKGDRWVEADSSSRRHSRYKFRRLKDAMKLFAAFELTSICRVVCIKFGGERSVVAEGHKKPRTAV